MVALRERGEALDVHAEQSREGLALGLAEVGELGGDVLHRAVTLAQLDTGETAGPTGRAEAAKPSRRRAETSASVRARGRDRPR